MRHFSTTALLLRFLCAGTMGLFSGRLTGAWEITHPYEGITYIVRSESTPRAVNLHLVIIDLTAPGIRFKVTPPGGTRETVRQTTLDFLVQEQAQVAINAHFFVPFPPVDATANVVGLAVSEGSVYSGFEPQPVGAGYLDQSYAIVSYAPALNIDRSNHADIVHRDPSYPDNRHILESVTLWNAVSGSAQIIDHGTKTIPAYSGTVPGLKPMNGFSDDHSWNDLLRARTVIALTADKRTLILFTVDEAGGSGGLTLSEAADLLIRDYHVDCALNLDGGPSTTLALRDPISGVAKVVNAPDSGPLGFAVGSNLAVFALPVETPARLLDITVTTANAVILSWPAALTDWRVQQNSGLDSSTWKTVIQSPQRVGDRLRIVLTPQMVGQFYRLGP
jgi:hypothetical protein